MTQQRRFFATILDDDFYTGDRYFECVFISKTESAARRKTDWSGGKTLRRRDTWTATHIDKITVIFIPNNRDYAAGIYRMDRK